MCVLWLWKSNVITYHAIGICEEETNDSKYVENDDFVKDNLSYRFDIVYEDWRKIKKKLNEEVL